jgi:hypothetical protein
MFYFTKLRFISSTKGYRFSQFSNNCSAAQNIVIQDAFNSQIVFQKKINRCDFLSGNVNQTFFTNNMCNFPVTTNKFAQAGVCTNTNNGG